MTRRVMASPRRSDTRVTDAAAVPWWAHQAVEYGLALLVVMQAIHARRRDCLKNGVTDAVAGPRPRRG
jgi:hypothetical protein